VQWLPAFYRDWLTQDVAYVISKQERLDFLKLTNDDERDLFIQQFWNRRNPDPSEPENSYKAEIYRRIAYANDHFSEPGGIGRLNDRGRVYITFGPPDHVLRTQIWGGRPKEVWQYRYLEGIGADVELEFVDIRNSGDHQLALAPEDQELLFNSQETGLTGMSQHNWQKTSHLENVEKVEDSPEEFKELETIVATHLAPADFPVQYRADESTASIGKPLIAIQVDVPLFDLQAKSSNSRAATGLDLFCRISDGKGYVTTLAEKIYPVGNDPATVSNTAYTIQENIPLEPGSYDLAIVVGNSRSHEKATVYTKLVVSGLQAD